MITQKEKDWLIENEDKVENKWYTLRAFYDDVARDLGYSSAIKLTVLLAEAEKSQSFYYKAVRQGKDEYQILYYLVDAYDYNKLLYVGTGEKTVKGEPTGKDVVDGLKIILGRFNIDLSKLVELNNNSKLYNVVWG